MRFRIDYRLYDYDDYLFKMGNKIVVADNKDEAKIKVKDSLSKEFRFKKMEAKAMIMEGKDTLNFLQDMFGFNNLN